MWWVSSRSGGILSCGRLYADFDVLQYPQPDLYQLLVYPMLVVVYQGADTILLKVS